MKLNNTSIDRNIYTACDVIGEIVYINGGMYVNHIGESSTMEIVIVSHSRNINYNFTLNIKNED